MAYNWAQLGFVEKWRLHAVRGHIVGMHRPEDKTYYDLRLKPGEGGAGQLARSVDLHLLDPGDLIREKRLGLLGRATAIVLLAAASPQSVSGPGAGHPPPARGRAQRWLESGSRVSGKVSQVEGELVLLDLGIPALVRLPENQAGSVWQAGQWMEFTVAETAKGFLVV